MKIVLAGGLSPERNVSLSSGAMVSEALREQGHQVALVDLFFGTEGVEGPAEALYDAPVPQAFKRIGRQGPDLAQVRAARVAGERQALAVDAVTGALLVQVGGHGGHLLHRHALDKLRHRFQVAVAAAGEFNGIDDAAL